MGGKRKSAKRIQPKKKATLAKVFKCVYCSHEGSCEVTLDRESETGDLACRVCGETFSCRITYLSDPVDVYCEWVDALEAAKDGGAASASLGGDDRRYGDDAAAARARGVDEERAERRAAARAGADDTADAAARVQPDDDRDDD